MIVPDTSKPKSVRYPLELDSGHIVLKDPKTSTIFYTPGKLSDYGMDSGKEESVDDRDNKDKVEPKPKMNIHDSSHQDKTQNENSRDAVENKPEDSLRVTNNPDDLVKNTHKVSNHQHISQNKDKDSAVELKQKNNPKPIQPNENKVETKKVENTVPRDILRSRLSQLSNLTSQTNSALPEVKKDENEVIPFTDNTTIEL